MNLRIDLETGYPMLNEKVASLLGHNSLNTTRIYTTPGERDMKVAVEKPAA